MLRIGDLKASIEGKEILKGIDLEVGPGELHVLMGPNGSGKSTLAQVIAGAPQFKVQSAKFKFEREDLGKLSPDRRAKMGIFLAFQHPVEIPGVSVFNVLRRAKQASGQHSRSVPGRSKAHSGSETSGLGQFRQELLEHVSSLKLSSDFLRRSLNEGFSGGEKKRSEILQMMALSPKLVILDEIDSGLDVDGLKLVAFAIKQFKANDTGSSFLLITHYARILKYLKPDFVHIMMDGRIIKSGKLELVRQIEEKGYQMLKDERLTTNVSLRAERSNLK